MQRAVLRLTTTSKGAIFHLDETFDPLRARFSPNPARYSRDEIRSIVAILKFLSLYLQLLEKCDYIVTFVYLYIVIFVYSSVI